MALVVKDRVRESTTTTGTGTYTLAGATPGFQSFSVIGDGNTTYYAATDGTDWEVGIGTYTASGTTLARTTILESSNSGSAVDWPAGEKDIFVTYPAERSVYLNAAGLAVDVLDIGTLGTSTANISTANITAGTVSTSPTNDTDIANKLYVDSLVVSGVHFHAPVRVESPTNLNATYNNGTSGVGATLTNAGTQVALVIDGVTLSVSDRVLIYTQTDQTQNGIYVVSDVGSGSTNWVLTRATDADSYGLASPDTLGEGSTVFVQQGATGAGETYTCNTPGTITFGTTNITFVQISSAQIYSAGTGLTLTGTQFSLSDVGTAGTYGSASQVPVFTTNAQGQVSSVTNTNIAIAGTAITSGTVAVAYGGTGQTTYTDGQLLIGNSSGNTLAKATLTAGTGIAITNGAGSITVAATNNGTVTSVDVSGGTTGLTTSGGPITGSGTITLAGTLAVTNGGTGGTTQSTARTGLGATTIGANLFTLTNPGAVTFPRFNADNSVSSLNASDFRTAIGAGTGSVTSVAGTGSVNGITLSGTVTSSGNLTLGGTLSGVSLTTQVTGTLPVANGGTGVTTSTGSGSNVLSTSPTLVTPVLGTPTSGNLSNCTVDGTDAVGFRNTPVNSQSAAYTLVIGDSGKTILHPASDNNARTFTIPANSSVAYAVGTVVTFVNLINTVTIAITSDTMYLAGDGSTGSRTLDAYGVATAVKVASTTWVISGNGLS
jgi:hypothetical protein